MGRLVRRPLADQDLEDIAVYVGRNDPDAAFRLIGAFERQIALLTEHPLIGRARDALAPGLHSVPHGRYLIFYRPIADGIELVRVVHGARLLENLPELG